MKPRNYCCCAIPIVNAGIYATLSEQFLLAVLVAILSLATPSIVGAATPAFASLVLAIICFVVSAIQILGFIGVVRENAILYRRYVTLHVLATSAAFAVAAAWTILSAVRHTTAENNCLANFFPPNESGTNSEGSVLCEIFPWVDVGIMGALWLIFALLHVYLYVVLSSYGTTQRRDHEKYDQLNNENIPMNRRSDPWDARASMDLEGAADDRGHLRQESMSDVLSQPHLQARDGFSNADYAYYPGSSPPRNHLQRGLSKGDRAVNI